MTKKNCLEAGNLYSQAPVNVIVSEERLLAPVDGVVTRSGSNRENNILADSAQSLATAMQNGGLQDSWADLPFVECTKTSRLLSIVT